MSKQAMNVPLGPLILRIAVVPGRRPLLLSNTLMRVLKASINMETQQLVSPHARKPVSLKLSSKGLYLINVNDLAQSIHSDRMHDGTTFHVETDVPSSGKVSALISDEQHPGSSHPKLESQHGSRSREAHERAGAEHELGGCGGHDSGGASTDQGEDRQDVQRLHIRRDVEEPQRLGEVGDQELRGQRQAPAPHASPVCLSQAGAGGEQPAHLSVGHGQGQEQGQPATSVDERARRDGERCQDRDGGGARSLGDGRGLGHLQRDCPHPERGGPPVGAPGQHGGHDLPDPHADPLLAAEHEHGKHGISRCLEQLTRLEPEEALMSAGDIDAHEHESLSEVSGHDQQLVQRLIQKYAHEIRQATQQERSQVRNTFLFEVFCGNQSQLSQQCETSQVRYQRFTIERGDLGTGAGRRELFQELAKHRPDHVWFAPTCTAWSGWSELNGSRSLEAYKQLTENRIKMLHQVALGLVLLRFQRASGKHMHWEQPRNSMMNRLACIRELRQLCHQANFDMCVIGKLECPQTGLPMRKSTTVFTTHQGLHDMLHGKVCTQHEEHQAIEGSILFQGERVNRSRFSENYTRRFARQVIQVLRKSKLHQNQQDPGWAFAANEEVGGTAIKRARLNVGESARLAKRPEPTRVQRLDEPKRQRLIGKQPSPESERAREVVKQVHAVTPRVGKVEIRDASIVAGLQAIFPEKRIEVIVACRGTDRTIGPPDGLRPETAPWRRALMIRRHDGALVVETHWEQWGLLPKTRQVRANHACKLNITAFGSALETVTQDAMDNSRSSAIESINEPIVTAGESQEHEIAGCSRERVHAESSDPGQGWAYRQLSGAERQWLAKIHKNLGHPSPDRLAQTLLGQGYQSRIVEAARQYQCSTCMEGKHGSLARPATLRDPLGFNDRVSMDGLIFSNSAGQQFRVYHLVDHGTSYQAAFVASSGETSAVISGIINTWLSWAGAPGELCVDAGRELNSESFQHFLQSHNIKCHTIAARAHWQNGRAERHGAILQTMLSKYDKEQAIRTTEDLQQALWAVTQAKNALSLRRGYSPEVLVLGKATRLPGSVISDESQPAHLLAESEAAQGIAFRQQLQRRETARRAFLEADNSAALRRAMLRQSRPDRQQYRPGEWIMMLIQKGNIPSQAEWIGPLKVMLQSDQNVVWASGSDRLYKGAPEHCRPVSAMEARRIPEGDATTTSQTQTETVNSNTIPSHSAANAPDEIPSSTNQVPPHRDEDTTSIETISQPDQEPSRQASSQNPSHPEIAAGVPVPETDDELFSDGGYAFACEDTQPMAWRTEIVVNDSDIDRWRHESTPSDMAFMVTASKKQHSEVRLTELTAEEQELFAQAKASEINNWLSNKAVEKVLRSQILADQVLRCRWILTWKAIDPSEITSPNKTHKPKARLVVLGYLDPDLENIPRDSPTLGRNSRMLILQLVASQGWILQSFDIKAAFLQGEPQAGRVMGLEPTEEFRKQFNMKLDQILRLVKGAYGLVDAPFLWYQALRTELVRLGLEEAPWDPTVFIMRDPKTHRPKGIIGMHVDDGLCGGDADFEALLKRLEAKYAFGSHKTGNFTYTGI